MSEKKEKDLDKILGMNRTMFFVIVALLCVLSLSIGIYAQVFYKYSDTDPFMLGIGIDKSQNEAEITALKTNFNNLFQNTITGTANITNIKKENDNQDLVYTVNTTTEKEDKKYNIQAKVPKINIKSTEAEKINAQIEVEYIDKISKIMDSSDEYIDYSVSYAAFLNGDLLSMIIKETEKEGTAQQSARYRTYNYNLKNNTQVSIEEIIGAKGYEISTIQKRITSEIKSLNDEEEKLKEQYSGIKLRDLNSSMYKVENTENYLVDQDGNFYIIYAYGNTENTIKTDLVIFK